MTDVQEGGLSARKSFFTKVLTAKISHIVSILPSNDGNLDIPNSHFSVTPLSLFFTCTFHVIKVVRLTSNQAVITQRSPD